MGFVWPSNPKVTRSTGQASAAVVHRSAAKQAHLGSPYQDPVECSCLIVRSSLDQASKFKQPWMFLGTSLHYHEDNSRRMRLLLIPNRPAMNLFTDTKSSSLCHFPHRTRWGSPSLASTCSPYSPGEHSKFKLRSRLL